jgi:hypothetical protein
MSDKRDNDDMRGEYDFSGAVRGKYASRDEAGSNVVILEPDVAARFKSSQEVNEPYASRTAEGWTHEHR